MFLEQANFRELLLGHLINNSFLLDLLRSSLRYLVDQIDIYILGSSNYIICFAIIKTSSLR